MELKQAYFPVLDSILMLLCGLLIIHEIIAIYFIRLTDLHITKMFKKKVRLYLQILSSVAAVFIIGAINNSSPDTSSHTLGYWIFMLVTAILGAYHFSNGFISASITLGICVSAKTKLIIKILAWIIAIFSMQQIIILLI